MAELSEHLRGMEPKTVGLAEKTCLDRLADTKAVLPYLLIEEKGSTGMYGPWQHDRSKLWLGMVSVGYTKKSGGSGGTFGYGKAGMIQSSAIRTVVAYTCFKERPDDPGVTRRLLGMTYWARHEKNSQSYTGFARLGRVGDSGYAEPFVNREADQIAKSLGMTIRSPSGTRERGTGTSFLLVEPRVCAIDLVRAIERYWWPALADHSLRFNAYVRTEDGKRLYPRPRKDPDLNTFIGAYEIATGATAVPSMGRRHPIRTGSEAGILGLVSDPDGWSFPGPGDDPSIEHRSIIALMRKPRMVVEYLSVRQTAPFARGAFVAHDQVDELLSGTEPSAHDLWQTKAEGDSSVPPEAYQLARKIKQGIKRRLRNFRKQLQPPERPSEHIELPHFDRIMRRLMAGHKTGPPPPPPPPPRPVTINLDHRLQEADGGAISLQGTVKVSLSEHCQEEKAKVAVSIRYRFLEDGKPGEAVETSITPHPGFVEDRKRPGVFLGELVKHERGVFEYTTDAYRSEWSGRLYAEAEIVEGSSS